MGAGEELGLLVICVATGLALSSLSLVFKILDCCVVDLCARKYPMSITAMAINITPNPMRGLTDASVNNKIAPTTLQVRAVKAVL